MLKSRIVWMGVLAVVLESLRASSSLHAVDIKCLPDDTEWVVTVNLKQIRSCALVIAEKDALDQPMAMLNRLARDVPVLKCLQDSGVDFFRELTSIRFAGPQSKIPNVDFVVVEGDFAAIKLADRLARLANKSPASVKITAAGGVTIYAMKGAGDTRTFAALVDDATLIAATTPEAAASAVARCNGSRKSDLPKGLKALLATMDESQSISFVASGPMVAILVQAASVPNAQTAIAALKSCEGLTAAITLTKDVQFQAGIHLGDEETAKKIAAAGVHGLLSLRVLVHQKAKEDQKLRPVADIVDILRIASRGPFVIVRGEATLDTIESLMRNLPVGDGKAIPVGPVR